MESATRGLYNPSYIRKLDKSQIPTCPIMGVEVAAINMEWLLNFTVENIKALSGDYMCVSNVHTTVTAYEDEQYRRVQNGGIMAIPDGGPLSSVGQKRGYKTMSRTTGPSYMEEIFKVSVEKGYRHYFYGSTEETLTLLKEKLEQDYPGIGIAGMYSPPFRAMSAQEDEEVVARINGFMVGVGAGFDYFAGNIERAPEWMQKSNLEWLYRLLQDPKRLFKRYLRTNTKFIIQALILKK